MSAAAPVRPRADSAEYLFGGLVALAVVDGRHDPQPDEAVWRIRSQLSTLEGPRSRQQGRSVQGRSMSDRESILEANRTFYRAFESLDAERMGEVWLRDQRIVCIHPGWSRLIGWGPIMNSWERIFENVFEMKVELGDPQVMMSGDLAVVVVEENLLQRGYDGTSHSRVLATNVFERAQGRWWIVSHHGSPVMEPPESEEPPLQ